MKPSLFAPERQKPDIQPTILRFGICRVCAYHASGRRDETIDDAMIDHKRVSPGCAIAVVDQRIG